MNDNVFVNMPVDGVTQWVKLSMVIAFADFPETGQRLVDLLGGTTIWTDLDMAELELIMSRYVGASFQ